jgi:enoyl-CoA hydratase/carnithine racemase
MTDTVKTATHGGVYHVEINRPHARNAVDGPTAHALYAAFEAFDADDALRVAVLSGANGAFCAGADLKAAWPRGMVIPSTPMARLPQWGRPVCVLVNLSLQR